jgi:hypothetical protein
MAHLAPDGDDVNQRQQRELQLLLTEAHDDVAASRAIALKAERQQRELSDQVCADLQGAEMHSCKCVQAIHQLIYDTALRSMDV